MGIIKKNVKDINDCSDFQIGVMSILDSYDYEIMDIRYIEEFKQLVVTIQGLVLFITEEDVSISFEISTGPHTVANLILILAESIPAKNLHLTDSFIITKDIKGNKIAVFGPDAQEIYERDLARETYNNKWFKFLMSPDLKFYDC